MNISKGLIARVIAIFLITVGVVYFGLNFFLKNGSSSRASGETMTYSFAPISTVQSNAEFHAILKVKSTTLGAMMTRGYSEVVTFDKNKLELKKIDYKFGSVSNGLGQTDANLAAINSSGSIELVGEINNPDGQPITNTTSLILVDLTFKYTGTGATSITLAKNAGTVYWYKTDGTIVEVPAAGVATLNVNGGGEENPTPTENPNCVERPVCALIFPPPSDCIEPTQGWCPSPTETGTPGGVDVKLKVKLKIQGIASKPSDSLDSLNIRFSLYDENTERTVDNDGSIFTAAANGIWSGDVDFNNVIPSHKYTLFVKGPFQVRKKVCIEKPVETDGGTYGCTKGIITLKAGDNDIDLTGIILLSGDLPTQDGTINAYDTSLIRNNLGKTEEDVISKCDVNRDGKCDTQDYSLLISTLSIKNDEK